jgi:hypothetical protein
MTEANKYARGKIYKITSVETDAVYFGSTCDTLASRLGGHRRDYRKFQNEKFSYVTSFEVVKFESAVITLVEDYPCARKEQLTARERYYIEKEDCINKCIPGRTKAEWYQDHREERNQSQKQYYQDNKEQIKARANSPHVCDCGGKYTTTNMAQHARSKRHVAYVNGATPPTTTDEDGHTTNEELL